MFSLSRYQTTPYSVKNWDIHTLILQETHIFQSVIPKNTYSFMVLFTILKAFVKYLFTRTRLTKFLWSTKRHRLPIFISPFSSIIILTHSTRYKANFIQPHKYLLLRILPVFYKGLHPTSNKVAYKWGPVINSRFYERDSY